MIKKIKVFSVWIDPEKEITSKKDGKVYRLCEVNVKVADDCKDYAGKYMKHAFFESKADPKKPGSKDRTATEQAEYFKSQNEGKEVLLDVEEEAYKTKDGKEGISLKFKTLSKAKREVAEQFVK